MIRPFLRCYCIIQTWVNVILSALLPVSLSISESPSPSARSPNRVPLLGVGSCNDKGGESNNIYRVSSAWNALAGPVTPLSLEKVQSPLTRACLIFCGRLFVATLCRARHINSSRERSGFASSLPHFSRLPAYLARRSLFFWTVYAGVGFEKNCRIHPTRLSGCNWRRVYVFVTDKLLNRSCRSEARHK